MMLSPYEKHDTHNKKWSLNAKSAPRGNAGLLWGRVRISGNYGKLKKADSSLNDLVRLNEDMLRDSHADLFGGLEINDDFEFRR